jgi:hypothetical protein
MDRCIGKARIGAKAIGQRPRALPLVSALTAALVWFLPGTAWSDDLSSTLARMPLGLYAHVDIEDVLPELTIQIVQSTTQPCAVVTASSSDQAALHLALREFYMTLLSDEAISGITAGVHWCRVQIEAPDKANTVCRAGLSDLPCYPDGNDWSYVDDLFIAVHNYNMMNNSNKTIQLIVTPGVYSPSWLTDGAILKSCDPLFNGTSSLPDCGMVTFNPYPEQRTALSTGAPLIVPMPLPWSSQYLYYWDRFLVDLATRYGKDQALVSVIMAGPTCATTEMILPTKDNNSLQYSGDDADQAWKTLIANSFNGNSTYATYPAQIFVDYWTLAIDTYERIFSDSKLTLILTPDDYINMPEFAGTSLPPPLLNNELKQDFVNFYNDNCNYVQFQKPPLPVLPLSCQTKATVAFYFLIHPIPLAISGNITKGTSVGGMTARSPLYTGLIDVPGVKLLTADPSPFTATGAPLSGGPFLGGAEFDHELTKFNLTDNSYEPSTNAFFPVSDNFQDQACLKTQPNCVCPNTQPNCVGYVSVEQGAFQVFANFFNGTKAAYLFNGDATTLPIQFQAPVQFVDVEWRDVMYALYTAGNCALASTTTSTQFPGRTLMQDVLNQANYGLKIIAGRPNIYPPALKCGSSP